MKIRMTKTAAGPEGSFLEGHVYEFEDESTAEAFIAAGAAILYIAPAAGSVTDVAELQDRVAAAEVETASVTVRADAAEVALSAAQEQLEDLKTAVTEASDLDELKILVATPTEVTDGGAVPPVTEPEAVQDEGKPRGRGGRKQAE